MMWMAWEHNPQGAFHESNGIHWGPWLSVGLSWFVPVFIVVLTIAILAVFTRRVLDRRRSEG